MNRQLYAYALIKTLHDNGQNYVDIFIPFLLSVLNSKHLESHKDTSIKQLIYDRHSLDIPIHMIRNIIRRTNQLKYTTTTVSKRTEITIKGMEYVKEFPTIKEVDRKINCFTEALFTFVKDHISQEQQIYIPHKDELMDIFFNFIYENAYCLLLFTKGQMEDDLVNNKPLFSTFRKFLIYIDKAHPDFYGIFEDILLGSVICMLAKSGELEKVYEYSKKRVFLDSNVVFSILGYHHDEFCIPCQELHQQLRKYKFQIYIFDFTLIQIINVLAKYRHEYLNYVDQVKVNSIYSNLKTMGVTPTDIDETIANIEDILLDYNILVYPTSTEERRKLEKDLEGKIDNFKRYKLFETSKKSMIHDLLAIEYTKKMRGRDTRKFDDTYCFFVTSDTNLTKYSLEIGGHKDNATISEVLLDSFMTSILWIKNPGNNDVNAKIFMSLYSEQRIINKNVWKKFIDITLELHKSGLIQKSDMSMLIYNKEIQETLAAIKENDVNQITPESIETLLSKTKMDFTKIEEDIDFYKNMLREKDNQIKENGFLIEQIIEDFRNQINEEADKSKKKLLVLIKAIFFFLLLCIGLSISYIGYRLNINLWVTFIAPPAGLFTLFGFVFNINKILENRIGLKVYNYYLRKYSKKFVPGKYSDDISKLLILQSNKKQLAG